MSRESDTGSDDSYEATNLIPESPLSTTSSTPSVSAKPSGTVSASINKRLPRMKAMPILPSKASSNSLLSSTTDSSNTNDSPEEEETALLRNNSSESSNTNTSDENSPVATTVPLPESLESSNSNTSNDDSPVATTVPLPESSNSNTSNDDSPVAATVPLPESSNSNTSNDDSPVATTVPLQESSNTSNDDSPVAATVPLQESSNTSNDDSPVAATVPLQESSESSNTSNDDSPVQTVSSAAPLAPLVQASTSSNFTSSDSSSETNSPVAPSIVPPSIAPLSVSSQPFKRQPLKSRIPRMGVKPVSSVPVPPASAAPPSAPPSAPRKRPIMKKLPQPSAPITSSVYYSLPETELLEKWNTIVDMKQRDELIAVMKERNIFPSEDTSRWEYDTGSYPDVIDPDFLQKLLAKREFAESLQQTWKPNHEPCDDQTTFEVTPVQRFVTNFMSPKTPYMSALLFHGVGVGKTCAATQIMEAWLEFYSNDSVFLIAPNTIQHGFLRTIFDINKVTIGKDNEPNSASQCTGINYMKLTNTLYERDKSKIERAVKKMISRRYRIFGYVAFANYIINVIEEGIPRNVTEEERLMFRKKNIRKHFSGKLLIVDEAHNLRDIMGAEQKVDDVGSKEDDDNAAGKILTPLLIDVLQYSEGMKFCALTATPMYNSYLEIVFILNLLLMNDKKATITSPDVFDVKGNITPGGLRILTATAQRYVSFMRGENPISFPVRLRPQDIPELPIYPTHNPRGSEIIESEKVFFEKLPIVPIPLQGDTMRATIQFMNELPEGDSGLNTVMMERLIHAGNFIVPETEDTKGSSTHAYTRRIDRDSLLTVFNREGTGTNTRYRSKPNIGASWLAANRLVEASPKFAFFLERIRNAEGCIFAYTRFVNGGALPLALILEANGYTPYHGKHLLVDGIQTAGGKQCALCNRKQQEHSGASHPFSPAYYGLLTGNSDISPHNDVAIRRQSDKTNKDGSQLKVLIGSQIASEGVDLRFIRETHIIDSWFHLNKTEQIIGRAIRFLSHCALPVKERNTTIYLYAATLPSDKRETADLYSYRIGFKKAVLIGNVTRVMKQAAVDCNLNKEAIVIQKEEPVEQTDSQRKTRMNVSINDMPFTAVCDWIETCTYQCSTPIRVNDTPLDDSTYDEYSARWRIHQTKNFLKERFEEQAFYQLEDLMNMFSMIQAPRTVISDVLNEVVNRKTFQVRHKGISGYIRYCNGYYLFQPNSYADTSMPIAIRIAQFPIKRDDYRPIEVNMDESKEELQVEPSQNSPSSSNIVTLWNAIVRWVTELSSHKQYIRPPEEIQQRQIEMSHDNKELLRMYAHIIEIIGIFYESFYQYHNPIAFRKALLEYFWDEWLTIKEQQMLISSQIDTQEYTKENQFPYNESIIYRFMNPETNMIDMIWKNGESCPASVIESVQQSKEDPLRRIIVNKSTTGELYGFMTPKRGGIIVFKTNHPSDISGKVDIGKECGNVSNKKQHFEYLHTIGKILQRVHQSTFHLDTENTEETSKLKNSVRVCTLMNLFLRFMDAERIDSKKWFFRPVFAYYTGHRGRITK